MAWQQDPQTGEWIMVDAAPAPSPAPDGGGYRNPDLQYIPPGSPPTGGRPYADPDPNIDDDRLDRWAKEEVYPKGYVLDVPRGLVVNGMTGEVVGPIPTFYRVN